MCDVVVVASVMGFSWVVWPLIGSAAAMGLLALVFPDTFAVLAQRGGSWVDTEELVKKLDERIDIDQHILRYSRVFGLAVVASALFLGYVYFTRVLGGTLPF